MSEISLPRFTPEQLQAMERSKDLLDYIDTSTCDHIIQYDPSQDEDPRFESFDKYLADNKMAKRRLKLQLPKGVLNIYLQRRFAAIEPEQFGSSEGGWSDDFKDTAYAPYRKLQVSYAALAHVGWQETPDREESYTFYRIHQPAQPLHNLGLTVADNLVHTIEYTPIDRTSDTDTLSEAVQAATQQLFTMAAASENLEEAETFEKQAEAAAGQQYIVSDCSSTEGPSRLLTAIEIEQLSNTLHMAEIYG